MPKESENLGVFHLRIKLAVLLSVTSVILIGCYFAFGLLRDQLTFAAAVIGGAAAVYTGYYTAATIRENISESRANASRTRMAASFDFLRQANQLGYSKIRTKLLTDVQFDKLGAEEIHQKIISDKELLEVVTNTLGCFEDMAIAIKAGFVDERILYYSINGTVCSMQKNLAHYIKVEKDNHGPHFYEEYETLVNSWRNHKSLFNGEEYPTTKYSVKGSPQ